MKVRYQIFTLLIFLLLAEYSLANTRRYRLTYRDNPSTTVVIGWDQDGGSNPVVHYDTVDHGTNHSLYQWTHGVDRQVSHKGMDNRFARLTGLQPNTAYYFLIRDSDGNSARMWFKTIPDDPSIPLSIVAGGDSRSNSTARQRCNMMVGKLRPHFVMFGGDYTDLNTSFEWEDWMDDWQQHIGADGRIIPIVATRGNHESSDGDIVDLFDIPSPNAYYALNFGGTLLRAYTLNTEYSQTGNQATWLQSDLAANTGQTWKFAQYHRPCRPHHSSKTDQSGVYDYWVPAFEQYGMNLVIECDAHVVKRTWPVLKSTATGSDEGFIRDDSLGIVYMGEGVWAPLRTADDPKAWSRDMGSFNGFNWIWVNECDVQIRTISTANVAQVTSVNDNAPFDIPQNLDIWSPGNGDVVTITNWACNKPTISLTNPTDGGFFPAPNPVNLTANAQDKSPGNVTQVEFFVDGQSIGTDNTAPWSVSYTPPSNGAYTAYAVATDNEGYTTQSQIHDFTVGIMDSLILVDQSSDDAEEGALGVMYLTSSDLELTNDAVDQDVGIRFNNLPIPKNATVTYAYIQFTANDENSALANLAIHGEDTDNAQTFSGGFSNISNRTKTTASVGWQPVAWNTLGESGQNQRTPDLSPILNELASRPGWSAGNSAAFIITGTGDRSAHAYDGSPVLCPRLYLSWEIPLGLPEFPQLIHFSAAPLGTDIQVKWAVDQQAPHTKYALEYSEDGKNFGKITQRSADPEQEMQTFGHKHRPEGQRHFYRLEMTSRDGQSEYSQVIEVKSLDISEQVKVYPNPGRDQFLVEVASPAELPLITLTGLNGAQTDIQPVAISGNMLYQVPLNGVGSGTYILSFRDGARYARKKVVVLK